MSKLVLVLGCLAAVAVAAGCTADPVDSTTSELQASGPYVVSSGDYRGLGHWVDTSGNFGPIQIEYVATGPDANGLYHGAQRSVAIGAATDAAAFAGAATVSGNDLVFAATYDYTYTSNTSFQISVLFGGQSIPIGAGTSAPGAYQTVVNVPSGPVSEVGFFGPHTLRRSGSLVSTQAGLTMFYEVALVR